MNKYKIFKERNNIAALVKERKDKQNSWHLDILLINDFSKTQDIISFLAKFAQIYTQTETPVITEKNAACSYFVLPVSYNILYDHFST